MNHSSPLIGPSSVMSRHQITPDNLLSILSAIKNLNRTMSSNSTAHRFFNDSRSTMNFYQFWLHSMYPLYNFTPNDSVQYLTCASNQNTTGNVIAMILYIIVCCIGLFGNTLVIYVVLKFSKMQTVTNRYILNLAIADESFLIGIPFLLTTMYLNEWVFGSFLCKLYMVSTSITQFSSSIFLLIMSADRFIAVCHPISSPRFRTQLVSKIVSLLAWGISALIMLPVMLYGKRWFMLHISLKWTLFCVFGSVAVGEVNRKSFPVMSLLLAITAELWLNNRVNYFGLLGLALGSNKVFERHNFYKLPMATRGKVYSQRKFVYSASFCDAKKFQQALVHEVKNVFKNIHWELHSFERNWSL